MLNSEFVINQAGLTKLTFMSSIKRRLVKLINNKIFFKETFKPSKKNNLFVKLPSIPQKQLLPNRSFICFKLLMSVY